MYKRQAGTMTKDSRSIVIDYNVLKQNEDMGVGILIFIASYFLVVIRNKDTTFYETSYV